MKMFILLSALFLLPPKLEKIYSREEIVGYYDYAVTKQWELELKEQGTFILTYKKKDTRFGKALGFEFIGTWENKNDTIVLTASPPISNQWCFNTVEYIVSERSLHLVGGNSCLPELFQVGNRFTVKI